MKCPLMLLIWQATEERKDYDFGDCLKEECAWWDGFLNQCAILRLEKELTDISIALNNIAKNTSIREVKHARKDNYKT